MQYLDDVDGERAFVLGDKRILNLYELLREIKNLDDNAYSYYANSDHNYFADWIAKIVGHLDLASSLRAAPSRQEAIDLLEDKIRDLSKAPEPKEAEKKPLVHKNKEPANDQQDMLKNIAEDEREIKDFLWKHFAWDMAKEFMYGLAIGILVGFILSKIFTGV